MSRKGLVITASLILLIAACGVWFLNESRKDTRFPTTASSVYDASSSADSYKNVGELVATATFSFEGTVLRVEHGEPVDYNDGSGGVIVPRMLVVEVGTVFHARDPATNPPSTLLVSDGYWEDGVGYERESMGWTQPGQSGFFLVRPSRGPDGDFLGRFSPIDDQGIALIEGEQVKYADDGVWQVLGSSATPDVFRDAVSEGASAAKSGAAKPVLRTICYPSVPGDENSEPICEEE